MVDLALAWRTGRAARVSRPKRAPVLVLLITYLARALPTWKRARSAVLQTAAFTSITFGLFTWSTLAGFIGAGVSLLVLEYLLKDER